MRDAMVLDREVGDKDNFDDDDRLVEVAFWERMIEDLQQKKKGTDLRSILVNVEKNEVVKNIKNTCRLSYHVYMYHATYIGDE
jgi:hypothetical protein